MPSAYCEAPSNRPHLLSPVGPAKDLSVGKRHNNLFSSSSFGAIHHVPTQSCSVADMYLLPFPIRQCQGDVFAEPDDGASTLPSPPGSGEAGSTMLCGKEEAA